MKTSPLLAAAALTLLSCDLPAYQIVQSYFHVEVRPNKYVDQLVLRCEDGRQITVPWQSKLAESCGEDLMGNVTLPRDGKLAPIDEEQKQAMLTQLRSQYGNISEKQVEFVQGPAGLTTRFRAPIVEVLKKYESCRKTHKDKAFCAGERDRALSKLADPEPSTPQADAQKSSAPQADAQEPAAPPADAQKPTALESDAHAARTEPPLAAVATQPVHADPVPAAPPVQGTPAEPAPAVAAPAPPSDAEVRANAERKIAADYTACMRAKPKYECDQSRAKAISALDNPKPAKPQRQRKQASAAVETQAAR